MQIFNRQVVRADEQALPDESWNEVSKIKNNLDETFLFSGSEQLRFIWILTRRAISLILSQDWEELKNTFFCERETWRNRDKESPVPQGCYSKIVWRKCEINLGTNFQASHVLSKGLKTNKETSRKNKRFHSCARSERIKRQTENSERISKQTRVTQRCRVVNKNRKGNSI